VCIILTSSACEPQIKGIEIVRYPDKLFYVVLVDDSLELSGGTAQYTHTKFSPTGPFEMDKGDIQVRHDIDFTKVGVYIVTLYKNEDISTTFEIQVVTQEEYAAMMGQEE
jgi:hypothetical protein